MSDFENEVRVAVSEALAAMGAADVAFPVEASNMENVDLAVPCFSMAKALRKAPQAIADELAGTIQPSGLIATVSSVNGFLNFCIDSAAMVSGVLSEVISKGACYGTMAPTGVRVNVEHTSTNPTGPIHVGRARNPVIGDTLARCLKRCGHDVTTEYYVNDVGKQVVILTWGVNNCPDGPVRNGDDSHFDDGLKAAYAAACEKFPDNGEDRDKVDHKTVLFYRRANAMMESSPVVQEQIADMLRRFEDGDQQVIDTVRKTAEMMLGGLRETLGSINVALDRYTWESGYIADGSARATVEEIKKSEYAGQTDDGAWFVDLKDFGIKGKNTKFTFTRSDGTTLYTTRDIAYHIDKFTRSDRVIDVLGEDQKLGSQQLCSVLDILGTGKQPCSTRSSPSPRERCPPGRESSSTSMTSSTRPSHVHTRRLARGAATCPRTGCARSQGLSESLPSGTTSSVSSPRSSSSSSGRRHSTSTVTLDPTSSTSTQGHAVS